MVDHPRIVRPSEPAQYQRPPALNQPVLAWPLEIKLQESPAARQAPLLSPYAWAMPVASAMPSERTKFASRRSAASDAEVTKACSTMMPVMFSSRDWRMIA